MTQDFASSYTMSVADCSVQAIQVYQKAVKEVSYEQLERSFRTNDLGIYIIAVVSLSRCRVYSHTLMCATGASRRRNT